MSSLEPLPALPAVELLLPPKSSPGLPPLLLAPPTVLSLPALLTGVPACPFNEP
jgi:hypothetical protein